MEAPKQGTGNYFVHHWRGELSLPVSCWINSVLVSGVLPQLLFSIANEISLGEYSLKTVVYLSLCALLFASLSWIWSITGIWRSAGRHARRGGSSKWAMAARILVILWAALSVYRIVGTYLPQLREYTLIAIGRDPLGKISVQVVQERHTLIVAGMFSEGAADKIRQALDAAPGVTVLMLHSHGGRLLEARSLAATIRERKLDTYVAGFCESACTLAFLAGRERTATADAKIGFHRPSLVGIDPRTLRKMTRKLLEDYRAAGMPVAFIERVLQTPPRRLWYPDPQELVKFNIVTRFVSTSKTQTPAVAGNPPD